MTLKHALFLCSGNYYRSRFAEELFNHCAHRDGLNWHATSRGLSLDDGTENVGPISRFTIEALKERNIAHLRADSYPEACTLADLESADLVVALKEAEHRELLRAQFPGWEDRVTFWHVHDLDTTSSEEAIEMIDRQVENLVRDIKSQRG
jgi:protein-tyrosine phosphatase